VVGKCHIPKEAFAHSSLTKEEEEKGTFFAEGLVAPRNRRVKSLWAWAKPQLIEVRGGQGESA